MQEYRFEFAAGYGKDEGIDFSNNRFINAAIYRSGVGGGGGGGGGGGMLDLV